MVLTHDILILLIKLIIFDKHKVNNGYVFKLSVEIVPHVILHY
jgi:hypothetical protein